MNRKMFKRLARSFRGTRHPQHFDMRHYARKTPCGTAMCIGGKTVVLAGDRLMFDGDDMADHCGDKNGKTWHIGVRAQQLLGLDEYAADSLFDVFAPGSFSSWPPEYRKKTPKERVRAAADLCEDIAAGRVAFDEEDLHWRKVGRDD